MLALAQGPVAELPAVDGVHGLIAAQAARTPDAVAVESDAGSLAYGRMWAQVERRKRSVL